MGEEDIENNIEKVEFEKPESEEENPLDSGHMEKTILEIPLQIKAGYDLGKDIKIEGTFNRIIICGMGGSCIPGDLLRIYLHDSNIPIETFRDYSLPNYIDKNTLVFCISYSGNTEETLSMFKEAMRRGCKTVCICSGARLEKLAETHRTPLIKVPSGLQPRAAVIYQFFPLIRILENNGLIPPKEKEVKNLIESLHKQDIKGLAEKLAGKLVDKIPLIYSSERFYPIAYRWKTGFNENAKIMAFSNKFSELNHNEINGYNNLKGDFHLIILTIDDDLRRMQKRIRVTKELIQKKGVPITEINIKGNYFLTKMFSAIQIGDLTSVYLAFKYKTDPTPVKIIEDLKEKLGPYI
ncbi:MAG: bifunctional phosphoglucose/phosphomannose isomerase [archaeon]